MNIEILYGENENVRDIWIPVSKKNIVHDNIGLKSNNENNNVFSTHNNEYDVFNKILREIENARKTIILSSFIIADDELENLLVKKSKEGVNIYVLTSFDIIQNKLTKNDLSDFDEMQLKGHKKMIERFSGNIKCRAASHLHAKFLMIDPVINGEFNKNSICYLSTANFDYKGLKVSPEVIMEIKMIENKYMIYNFFQQGFWNEATEELINDSEKNWRISEINRMRQPRFEMAKIDISVTMKSKNTLREKLNELIDKNYNELILSAFTFESEQETIQKLLLKNSNLRIQVITRDRPRNYQFFYEMLQKFENLEIILMKNLHAKFLLGVKDNDQYDGIIFTANFAKYGLDEGYELGIELNENECIQLKYIFDNWKNKSDHILNRKISFDILKKYENKTVKFFRNLKFEDKKVKMKNIIENNYKINKLEDFERAVRDSLNREISFEDSQNIYIENYLKFNFTFNKFNQNIINEKNYTLSELEIDKIKFDIYYNKKVESEKYLILNRESQLDKLMKLTEIKKFQNMKILQE